MISLAAKSQIVVDAGAKSALTKRNKSLLPAGISEVNGAFSRGDIVAIADSEGNSIATGISNYNSADVSKIKGHPSSSIMGILGHGYGEEVVHRDNLIIL